MASRKPTGIVDDIAKGIYKGVKTISSPWLGAPPGQNRSVTQAQGLARGAAETLDQTFAGGMIKAGTQGNKALVKQAGVNAASLATGYIAGKAVVASGVVPRIINKVTGKTIGTHGSPVRGLTSIDPRISRSDVDVPTVSFMRTNVPPNMRTSNVSVNQQYAGGQGSIYVVKADKTTSNLPSYKGYVKNQKATVKTNAEGRPMLHFPPTVATKTTTSAKVVAEIPVNKFPTEAQLRAEVARQTRLAGASLRNKSVRDKVEEKARQLAMKQRNKKSVT